MKKKYSINLAGSVFIYNLGGSVFIYNFINFSLGLNMSQVCMRLVWLPIRQGLLNRWTSQLDLGITAGGLERGVSVHYSA